MELQHINISEITEEKYGIVQQLILDMNKDSHLELGYEELLTILEDQHKELHYILGYNDDELTGFAKCIYTETDNIKDEFTGPAVPIIVKEKYRGQGYGTMLANDLFTLLKEMGAQQFHFYPPKSIISDIAIRTSMIHQRISDLQKETKVYALDHIKFIKKDE